MSRQTREAAYEAARRSGISVGDWLDRVILNSALQGGVDPRRLPQPRQDPPEDRADADPPCSIDLVVETLRDDLAGIRQTLQEAMPDRVLQVLESKRDVLRALRPTESLLSMAQEVQQLSQKIAEVIEKLDASATRINRLEAMERGLAELLIHLASQRVPNLAPAAVVAPEPDTLSRDIADFRQTQNKAQGSLEIIHDALRHVVDRLAVIETNMRGRVSPPSDASSTPTPEADWLALAPRPALKPAVAAHELAAPTPAEPDSGSPASKPAAFPSRSIDSSLSPDHSLKFASSAAPRQEPASPAEPVLAPESTLGGVKLSVIPDCGDRSDFIAAARRAAQAAGRNIAAEIAAEHGASGVAETPSAAAGPDSGIGRGRALIGATVAILIVLGLLQMARILINPSREATGPSHAAVTSDALVPSSISADQMAWPALPVIEGVAVATGKTGILVPVWTSEQAEITGQVQAPTGGKGGAKAAASAPPSAKPAASAPRLDRDLAMPRLAQ